jgi:capsular polysaccharide transport system ATP-binding protein
MIVFDKAGKAFRNRKGVIGWVFRDFSNVFDDHVNMAVLAPRGQGKSTLIELAAGNIAPSEGNIYRQGGISWPYNSKSIISSRLTGRQNLRFLCDVYGRNFTKAYDFVAEFSDLGRYLDMSLRTYNGEMRSRLSISALFAMNFSHILVDDSMDGGDNTFRKKCNEFLEGSKDELTLLIATSNPQVASKYCQSGCLLNEGKFTVYDSVEDAILEFNKVNHELV